MGISEAKKQKDQYETRLKADTVAILNKIRTEIKQRPYGVANDSVIQGIKYERAAILEILDKYKAESVH